MMRAVFIFNILLNSYLTVFCGLLQIISALMFNEIYNDTTDGNKLLREPIRQYKEIFSHLKTRRTNSKTAKISIKLERDDLINNFNSTAALYFLTTPTHLSSKYNFSYTYTAESDKIKDRSFIVKNLIFNDKTNGNKAIITTKIRRSALKNDPIIDSHKAYGHHAHALAAYRMQCHSCMSGYLENHFMYISHLYRKPLSFSEKCDRSKFDSNYVQIKNCTDACIMLRMNDKVGGRRRNGYMRGCLSDIIYYNQSAIRGVFDDFGQQNSDSYSNKFLSSIDGINAHNRQKSHSSSSYSSASSCSYIRLRDLFLHSDRYTFEPHDYVKVCTCTHALCNHTRDRSYSIYLFMIAIIITFVS